MHPKDADSIANSEDSDLGLHYLPRPICPQTQDHYSKDLASHLARIYTNLTSIQISWEMQLSYEMNSHPFVCGTIWFYIFFNTFTG